MSAYTLGNIPDTVIKTLVVCRGVAMTIQGENLTHVKHGGHTSQLMVTREDMRIHTGLTCLKCEMCRTQLNFTERSSMKWHTYMHSHREETLRT